MVPLHLRKTYHKKEIRIALKTGNVRTAEQRAKMLEYELANMFLKVSKIMSIDGNELTTYEIQKIVDDYIQTVFKKQFPIKYYDVAPIEAHRLARENHEQIEYFDNILKSGDYGSIALDSNDILLKAGITNITRELKENFTNAFLRESYKHLSKRQKVLEGSNPQEVEFEETDKFDWKHTANINTESKQLPQKSHSIEPTAQHKKVHASPKGPLLSEIFERYLILTEDNRGAEADRTIEQRWYVLIDYFDDIPANSLTSEDIMNFMKDLETRKNNFGHPISGRTYNQYLTTFYAVFDIAISVYDEITQNHFNKKIFNKKINLNNSTYRDIWGEKEIQILFSTRIYTGISSKTFTGKKNVNYPYYYWLPLLGLYTGARLNELCQLSVDDIVEIEGKHFIHVNLNDSRKKIKRNKPRYIPIHHDLIEFGFLEYVKLMKLPKNKCIDEIKVARL